MIKQLILIRHAHRDNANRSLDNGLSPKGEKQARWLKQYVAARFNREEWRDLSAMILSSPKRRCLETLKGISEHFGLPCEKEIGIDEQKVSESVVQFDARVHEFLNWWVKEAPPVVVACSHGDWLPLAAFHLLGTPIEMKKGSWLEIEWDEGRAQLRSYIPSFKVFYGP